MNLSMRLTNTLDDADSTYTSGICDLVIDTKDQGQPNFHMLVGALRNGSGTPLEGTQNASFGANDGGELTRVGDEDGGHDPLGLATMTMLTTSSDRSRAGPSDPRLPMPVQFAPTVTAFPAANATTPFTTMGNTSGVGVTTNATVSSVPTSPTTMANTSGAGATNTSQSANRQSQEARQNDPQAS